MRCVLIIGAFITLLASPLRSQLSDSDTSGARGKVSVGGSYTAGTVNRTLVVTSAEFGTANESVGLWSGLAYTYGTFSGRVTERDILSRTFGYLSPYQRVYPFVMLWADRSVRRAVALRLQPAVGGTVVAVRTEHASLRVSLSAAPEFVKWSAPLPSGETYQQVMRAIGRVAVHARTEDRVFGVDAEFWVQPNVQDLTDLRAFAQGTASAQLWKAVRLQSTVTWLRESTVPSSVQRNDLFITLGISYTFGEGS